MTGIPLYKTEDGLYDIRLDGAPIRLMETTAQNQALLLESRAGDWEEHPETGVGLPDIVLDHDLGYWRRRIISQLERDGQRVKSLKLTTDRLDLKAEYK